MAVMHPCRLSLLWRAAAVGISFSVASAQTVAITASALAPLVVDASVGAVQVTDTQAVGPLPQNLLLLAQVPPSAAGQASANFLWDLVPSLQSVRLRGLVISSGSATPLAASTSLIDVLLQVQASSPVLARLQVDRTITATAGSLAPLLRIDVGNDGTFEVTENSPPGFGVANIALGPQPLSVRVLLRVESVAAQTVAADMTMRFIAQNQLTTSQMAVGCVAPHGFTVEPSFVGTGIQVTADPFFANDVVAAVFGTGVQPVVLPSSLPGCVLLPSPDIVVLLQNGTPLQVPLPPAVRPVSFWVQGAVLWLSGLGAWNGELTTTAAYFIDAS